MMNKKIVKLLLVLVAGCACATWSPAQEEDAASGKKPVSKALSSAQVKALNKKKAAEAKAAAEARARAVDLNHASRAALKKLPGITDAYADAIIAKRPYKSKADLVVKNVIPMDLYQALRKQVAAK
jgi:DNA uptake protein ComE-like DNA-binding protein